MTDPAPLSRLAAVLVLVLAVGRPVAAAPRDEAARFAPPDAAIVLVVQNARDHVQAVRKSPFAEWFPASALGRQLAATTNLGQLRESAAPAFLALGTTPDELLNDVFGDAVVFAYTPAPASEPTGERAVLLVRPRKPETLTKLVERLNDLQTRSGELKAVTRRTHHGEEYYERQRAAGGSEFYCFRGGVFAFSGTEPDIQAVIDRDTAGDKPPALVSRMTRLGVADAAAVLLVNPRSLDADVKAKLAAAKADERPFLDRFAEAWAALEAAAVYVSVGAGVEAGVSLDFRPGALPATAKAWLTGPRTPSALWAAVPDNALFAATARFRAGELVTAVRSLLPERGRTALDAAVGGTLGPVVGRDRLPLVLDALGPDWAVWLEPPPGDTFLPVAVGAVRVSTDRPRGKETGRAIERAVGFGFQAARVAYNAGHTDQIELQETEDGGAVVTSLVNPAGFPPGVRPSFAFRGGYLVVASSPDAIRRFRTPTGDAKPTNEAVAVRFSGTATRAYLHTHRAKLAEFLAKSGRGGETDVLKQLDQFAAVLEPVERVELITCGSENGLRLALRAKLVKPLK